MDFSELQLLLSAHLSWHEDMMEGRMSWKNAVNRLRCYGRELVKSIVIMADVVKFNRHYTVIGPAVKKMLKCPYQIYVFLFRGKCYPSDRCADMINVSARSLHGNNAGSCSLRILTFKSIRTLHILQFPGIYYQLLAATRCWLLYVLCFFNLFFFLRSLVSLDTKLY